MHVTCKQKKIVFDKAIRKQQQRATTTTTTTKRNVSGALRNTLVICKASEIIKHLQFIFSTEVCIVIWYPSASPKNVRTKKNEKEEAIQYTHTHRAATTTTFQCAAAGRRNVCIFVINLSCFLSGRFESHDTFFFSSMLLKKNDRTYRVFNVEFFWYMNQMQVQMVDRCQCTQRVITDAIAAIIEPGNCVNGKFDGFFFNNLWQTFVQSWANQRMVFGQRTVVHQKCGRSKCKWQPFHKLHFAAFIQLALALNKCFAHFHLFKIE